MIHSKQAKLIGRAMLRDHKGLIAGCFGLFFLISFGISLLGTVFSLQPLLSFLWLFLSTLLTVSLSLGLYHLLNRIYFRQPAQIGDLFAFFQNYTSVLKVIGVSLIYSVLLFLLIFVLALLFFGGAVAGLILNPSAANLLQNYIGSFLLFFVLFAVLLVILSSIQISCYMLVLRSPNLTFGQLLGGSFQIGLRYAWRYFCFTLSFIGWVLLASLLITVSVFASFFSSLFGILLILLAVAGVLLISVYQIVSSIAFFNGALDSYAATHPAFFPQRPESGDDMQ